MPLNQIWEATFTQSWGDGGESLLMKFYYSSVDAGANSGDLASGMQEPNAIIDRLNAAQGAIVKNVGLRVINLGSLLDFIDTDVAGAGNPTYAEVLPPHSAVNFTLKLNTRAVRPGSKRMSGIPENFQNNGIITDSDYIELLNLVRLELAEPVTFESKSFNPVVVKRVGLPTPGTPPYTSYRLPEDDGELVFGVVSVATVNLKVSHQVSRGNGR